MEQYNENALDMFSNIKKELEEMLKNVHTDPRVDMFQDVYRKEIEIIEECETALEKQIPKKPSFHGYREGREVNTISYTCPACNRHLSDYNYCPDCGQALDWGDS